MKRYKKENSLKGIGKKKVYILNYKKKKKKLIKI